MIPIYVISLDRSHRFKRLSKDLHEQGLKFETIRALNGRNLSREFLDANVDKRSSYARLGYVMSPALIGCALSHQLAYTKGLEENQSWIIVLEEDVRLLSDFEKHIETIVRNLDECNPYVCQLFTRGERFICNNSIEKIEEDRFLFNFAIPPGQTAGYLINREALLIAKSEEKLSGPPDWPNWSHSVSFVGTFPYLISETGEDTSIGSPPMNRVDYWLRNLLKLLTFHFFRYHKSYPNIRSYYLFEIKPLFLRFKWKLKGGPTLPSGDTSGLWIS